MRMSSGFSEIMSQIMDEAYMLGMASRRNSDSKDDKINKERTMSKSEVSKDDVRRKKQGRNELCNCGSELKFKKCCGKVINKED